MNGKDTGVLYVLTNRDRSLSKVGMTRFSNPAARARDYTRIYSIEWRAYWSAATRDVAAVEARCHRELARHRFVNAPPGAKEVFFVVPQDAVAIAKRHVVSPETIPWRLRLPLRQLWNCAVAFAVILVLCRLFGGP
jgi:hypothetical protein